ncbi:MAG: Ig-like domain-containing protein [Candidatus Latescibacterota bacterium]
MTVRSVNDPPVLEAFPEISFVSGGSKRLALGRRTSDEDHPFSDLTWSASGNGNIRVAFESGEAVFTAPAGWAGTERFELTVSDPQGGKASAPIQVTVAPAEE